MDLTLEQLRQTMRGLFPELLGVQLSEAGPELVRATLKVGEALCTTPGVMHGGALMAFADTLGAYATVLNLPDGAGTTTIESKTNFFARATSGREIVGECRPLHRGRRTMVWETRISRDDGRLVAAVTQTQIVLPRELGANEVLAGFFADGEVADQQKLLAGLERSGGALYRSWARSEVDAEARALLLEAAEREDRNAEVLETLLQRAKQPKSDEAS
jgi:1,4-dihydroxy-2-naphthoyl-CoA hydrolase